MCGIGGLISNASGATQGSLAPDVQSMLDAMVHRGPDQGALLTLHGSTSVAVLGARRLAVQDLSDAGSQPMMDPATGNVIVFNGEVYNFQDLRNRLISLGARLESGSDTEAVLHGYREFGSAIVHQLRGMFAFAIWDRSQQQLFLARDRLGVKPLYYRREPNRITFASEVRALLTTDRAPELNPAAVRSFLAFGAVREPTTILKGVRAFPPGSSAYVTATSLVPRPYWSLGEAFSKENLVSSRQEALAEINRLLKESIKLRLVSDAPTGLFLSGGVDSTVVACLAAVESPRPIRTVSVVFSEQGFSEKPAIDRTVAHLGSDHTEIELSDNDLLRLLPSALRSYDQPTLDALNTYVVSLYAHGLGLKVALSGIGGDELFGGYPSFRQVPRLRAFRRAVPRPILFASLGLASHLPIRQDRVRKLYRYMVGDGSGNTPAEFLHRELFSADERVALSSVSSTSTVTDMGMGQWIAPELDEFNAISFAEISGYLLNTLLRDTDFASMASSLEVREPYLDHELVTAVASLPGAVKASATPNALLREVARTNVPSALLQPGKRGFAFPMDRWMRGQLREEVADVLMNPTGSFGLSDLVSNVEVQRTWLAFLERRVAWTRPWSLYVLKSWCRIWGPA